MKDLVELFKENHLNNSKEEKEYTINFSVDEFSLPSSGRSPERKEVERLTEKKVIQLKAKRTANKAA